MAHVISSAPAHFSITHFFKMAIKNLNDAAAKRRAFQITRRELTALSDANLADLGMTRSEINRVALEASIGSSRH